MTSRKHSDYVNIDYDNSKIYDKKITGPVYTPIVPKLVNAIKERERKEKERDRKDKELYRRIIENMGEIDNELSIINISITNLNSNLSGVTIKGLLNEAGKSIDSAAIIINNLTGHIIKLQKAINSEDK